MSKKQVTQWTVHTLKFDLRVTHTFRAPWHSGRRTRPDCDAKVPGICRRLSTASFTVVSAVCVWPFSNLHNWPHKFAWWGPQIWSQSLQTSRPVVGDARANPCGVCAGLSSSRCLRAVWATSKRHLIGQSQFMSKKQNTHWCDVNLLCSRRNSNPQWQPLASETGAWLDFYPRGPSRQVINWKYSFGTVCVCVRVWERERQRERQRHAFAAPFPASHKAGSSQL